MCLALKYMHDRHVLHRDIKTQNIFLAQREGGPMGSVKIADFGISKRLTDESFARTMVGTPYYLSPEMCQNQPYACPSDIWALGCVVYELCALRVPFEAQNVLQLVERIVRGPLPRAPSAYSREVGDVIAEMLSKDARERPSAAALLQRSFVQHTIKKMLGENQKDGKRHGDDDRSARRAPSKHADGKHGDGPHSHRDRDCEHGEGPRPLQEHNPRCARPSTARGGQRAENKPSSRAPSPHKGAAKEVLRPIRAPSPACGGACDRHGRHSPSPMARHHGRV